MNFIDVLSALTRDRWYWNELIRVLRSGPGAASLYFSAFCGSLCLMLSFAFVKEMEAASMAVFLVTLTLSSSFIIFDLWFYLRNHGLELLRRAGWRCERRMRRLHVESSSIFAFLDRLYGDPDLQKIFRMRPNESIQTLIKTLDRLSSVAICYGPGGKYVFMYNLKSCPVADLLFGSRGIEFISEPLGPEIRRRLEQVPCYDPEGWSLIFGTSSLKARDSVLGNPPFELSYPVAGVPDLFLRPSCIVAVVSSR